MNKIVRLILSAICLALPPVSQAETIKVPATSGDATLHLQAAIDQAGKLKGKAVTIQLEQGDYNLYRNSCSQAVYYISNTASQHENPDPTKHIGLWMKGMKNVTIDGGGAKLVTHGEMSSFIIDSCENIVLRNFAIAAADPSVPEMTIEEVGDHYLTARIHPDSEYEIAGGRLTWKGHGWSFTGGIAQVFDPTTNVTVRCQSPMSGVVRAVELEKGLIRFNYAKRPDTQPGQVFQMRDGIRDEVCGFIHKSKNIVLEDLNIHFLGNFGIVGQYSENLTYNRIKCEPEWGKGRTCAGFADFVQMSGCKGKLKILNSRFEGAHDDPINIHGTHLKVVEYISFDQIRVRFMHHQSFGFEAFFKGDQIELVDANSLLCLQAAKVKQVRQLDLYDMILTLDKPVSESIRQYNIVVENTTWTPEVEIENNYFARIPTRGILITTRRKVLIKNNIFYRTPMSGILIANDARSWYESGPVEDVTICNNLFIECGAPVINIAPENDKAEGAVHRNIRILSNRFILGSKDAVHARGVDGISIRDNFFVFPEALSADSFIKLEDCEKVTTANNRVGEK